MNAETIEHPCGRCRVGHLGDRCWAKALANRHMCDLVAGDDGYLALVRLKSGAAPEPPAAKASPRVAQGLALQRRARSCPSYRRADCGCYFGTCAAGRGDVTGRIGLRDCLDCPDLPETAP